MKDSQSTQQPTSFATQLSDPLLKIGTARSMVETVRMAHHCPTDDIDFEALEEIMRMASGQMQDALQEIEDILKKAA